MGEKTFCKWSETPSSSSCSNNNQSKVNVSLCSWQRESLNTFWPIRMQSFRALWWTWAMLWWLCTVCERCVINLVPPGVPQEVRMNVGVAHSEGNPNTRVMNSRGIWLTYALGVGMLHIVLLSIPFFSVPVVWTLTNVIHNLVSPPCSPASSFFSFSTVAVYGPLLRNVFLSLRNQSVPKFLHVFRLLLGQRGKSSAWRKAVEIPPVFCLRQ